MPIYLFSQFPSSFCSFLHPGSNTSARCVKNCTIYLSQGHNFAFVLRQRADFFFFFQLQKLLDLDENMFGFFFNIYFLPFLRVEKAIKKVAQLNARSCADEKNIKSLWKKSQRHISVFTTWRF